MNYYKHLSDRDLIGRLKQYFDEGRLFLRHDGKISQTTRLSYNTPWIHHKLAPNRACGLYHIFYTAFGFIHSVCQECWKVVVRPRTLKELDLLMNLQRQLDRPSKCGIERRPTVCGLYGGYFYTDSLEEGLECYKLVRKVVDEAISPEVACILKRACTEFEIDHKFGPSDQWQISEDQIALEKRLADLVDMDVDKMPQPEHLKESVFREWIHWAYQNGDLTYKEYTNGQPLFRPLKTYHEDPPKKESKHSPSGSKRNRRTKQ